MEGSWKTRRKLCTNKIQFYDTDEKKNETVSVYSRNKQFISEGFEFKSDFGTYSLKLGDDLKHMRKTFNWLLKDTFDFQAYYCDLNMFFVFDTKFYGSNTGYIKDYNELIKTVPNPVTSQIGGILTDFVITKNTNKKVIVKSSTYYALSEKEKQNVVLVVTNIINNRVYFNDKKSIYVGFHKHSQKSPNI